jgi:hypothetical protein
MPTTLSNPPPSGPTCSGGIVGPAPPAPPSLHCARSQNPPLVLPCPKLQLPRHNLATPAAPGSCFPISLPRDWAHSRGPRHQTQYVSRPIPPSLHTHPFLIAPPCPILYTCAHTCPLVGRLCHCRGARHPPPQSCPIDLSQPLVTLCQQLPHSISLSTSRLQRLPTSLPALTRLRAHPPAMPLLPMPLNCLSNHASLSAPKLLRLPTQSLGAHSPNSLGLPVLTLTRCRAPHHSPTCRSNCWSRCASGCPTTVCLSTFRLQGCPALPSLTFQPTAAPHILP